MAKKQTENTLPTRETDEVGFLIRAYDKIGCKIARQLHGEGYEIALDLDPQWNGPYRIYQASMYNIHHPAVKEFRKRFMTRIGSERAKCADNRLIDYEKYLAGRRSGNMGSVFKMECFLPLGKKVYDMGASMIQNRPMFKGANRLGMYLKWGFQTKSYWPLPLSGPCEPPAGCLVFSDWLKEQNLLVTEMEISCVERDSMTKIASHTPRNPYHQYYINQNGVWKYEYSYTTYIKYNLA